MIPDQLKTGYAQFRAERFEKKQRIWRNLAKGQSPRVLVIGCADSRVDPAAIFNAGPGELFIVRNVANLVPPYEPDGAHHGVSAALEFAVKSLKVEHIVVLGHRQCGGVHAAATGAAKGTQFIERWLDPLAPACAEARAALGADVDEETLCDDLELRSIRHSLVRLTGFPFVAEAVETGRVTLHGARFGIADGALEWMDGEGRFVPVEIEDADDAGAEEHS
ncbi:carbonic anhydrase [Alkalicaulis satelles]|uniref:Carbonic anhydrase n=1 Tax=Alkalicaulis satelles TaxID=2609175 RepID=A0A5M6ZKG2_9PROT|nr:carbonic anhydrase [Alkalicaulis satelles]KAA5804820.1 carbonic anhydrase [Alkalicaulis satelles]